MLRKREQLVLIHLSGQRTAVAEYVKGRSREEILNWIKQHGVLVEPHAGDSAGIYGFESNYGYKDAFYFGSEGALVILNSGWLA